MQTWTFLSCSLAGIAIFFGIFEFLPIPANAESKIEESSKHPFHYKTPTTIELERSRWNGSQTIIDAVSAQRPTRFSSPFVADWPALKWDFWKLSSKWSILLDVLVLDRPLFIFNEVDLATYDLSLHLSGRKRIGGTG
jgi:hypothetical protein